MKDTLFDWMGSTVRQSPERTRSAHERELNAKARLYARLGVPKKTAEDKLAAALTWEFERVGKPAIQKKLAAVVTAAYKMAGPGKKVD